MPDEAELLEPRSLRQRIGGRWAISRQGFVITALLGLLALIAGEQHAIASGAAFGRWIALFILAMGMAGCLVLAANYSIFRNRRIQPLPVWLVIAFHGSCGVVYSLIVSLGVTRLGLQTDVSLVERASLNALYAMWWGPTLSYFLDYRDQLRRARRTILADAVDIELARAQQDELARRMSDDLMAEVDMQLVPARDAISAMLLTLEETSVSSADRDEHEWATAAALLRGTAIDSVRPLSRRIWTQADVRHPREKWWNIPSNIVQHQPFRPIAFAVVDVLGTLAQQARIFGVVDALALLASGLVVTIGFMLAANALMRKRPARHAWIFLGTLLALQLTVALRTWLRESLVPGSAPLSWQITQVLATILVVFITSAFGGWRDKERETLINLRNDLQHEQVVALARSRQVATVAREMAQVLHGSVQSRLLACAMALDADDRQNGDAALNATLALALDALANPMPTRDLAGTMVEEVNRKVALWEGFCTFDIRISDGATRSANGAIVGRVVEEGITNALRHGRATHIAIDIESSADATLTIVMVDNGLGPQAGAPGLGTAYLQQATGGRWSLTSRPSGTCMEVRIPA